MWDTGSSHYQVPKKEKESTASRCLAVKQVDRAPSPALGQRDLGLTLPSIPVPARFNSLPALPQFSHPRNGSNVGAGHASDVGCNRSKENMMEIVSHGGPQMISCTLVIRTMHWTEPSVKTRRPGSHLFFRWPSRVRT